MGVGRIHKHSKDSRQYRVDSIEELQVIIDHFDKYPLMTARHQIMLYSKKHLI